MKISNLLYRQMKAEAAYELQGQLHNDAINRVARSASLPDILKAQHALYHAALAARYFSNATLVVARFLEVEVSLPTDTEWSTLIKEIEDFGVYIDTTVLLGLEPSPEPYANHSHRLHGFTVAIYDAYDRVYEALDKSEKTPSVAHLFQGRP